MSMKVLHIGLPVRISGVLMKAASVTGSGASPFFQVAQMFYRASVVKRRKLAKDPGPGFRILKFHGEENSGRVRRRKVLRKLIFM